MNVLDLFSGIGGFALGLECAGFTTVAFCEIRPSCVRLLNHHWPAVPCYDDVETLTGERLYTDGLHIDLICGGFPCQDISLAGDGRGLDGARSGLWREYARIIGEVRPRYVIVENVSALLIRGMGTVIGDLASFGYDCWWDCVSASAVGAPHRRDRLWIIAYPRGEQYQGFGDALRWEIAARLSGAVMADADLARLEGRHGAVLQECPCQRPSGAHGPCAPEGVGLADPYGEYVHGSGLSGPGWRRQLANGGWWLSEPDVGRVANGIPARVDRLHGLGNAVIPKIPFILGASIMAAEQRIVS